jgi:hypothetical protein
MFPLGPDGQPRGEARGGWAAQPAPGPRQTPSPGHVRVPLRQTPSPRPPGQPAAGLPPAHAPGAKPAADQRAGKRGRRGRRPGVLQLCALAEHPARPRGGQRAAGHHRQRAHRAHRPAGAAAGRAGPGRQRHGPVRGQRRGQRPTAGHRGRPGRRRAVRPGQRGGGQRPAKNRRPGLGNAEKRAYLGRKDPRPIGPARAAGAAALCRGQRGCSTTGTVLHEQEAYIDNTASWSWQQLSVGKLATQDCWAEVYVENLGSVPVWFDDLEIAAGGQPVAVVVQEAHADGQSMTRGGWSWRG